MLLSPLQSALISATDALRNAVMALRQAHIDTASLDARLLLEHALGVSREELLSDSNLRLSAKQEAFYRTLIDERIGRKPVAQLTGRREFWGMAFKVTPATLDPRPDSETLIEAVLEWVTGQESWVMGKMTNDQRPMTILDLGTGTGCLLLALLKELKHAKGIGVDISEEALSVAWENAAALGLEARASFARSDWAQTIEGTFDIIISNPPYIPSNAIARLAPEVRDHEPTLALDGGADGLEAYRKIIPRMERFLAKGGCRPGDRHGAGEGSKGNRRWLLAARRWQKTRFKRHYPMYACAPFEQRATSDE